MLVRAGLIEAARKGNWSRLPDILSYIKNTKNNEVCRTSLVRLLRSCADEPKVAPITPAFKRSLATGAGERRPGHLRQFDPREHRCPSCQPRPIRCDWSGSGPRKRSRQSSDRVPEGVKQHLKAAQAEFLSALNARPDDWSSHYNLGNFYASRNEIEKAIASYETALRLEPRALLPLTNIAIVYGQRGEYEKAETSLRRAIEIDPRAPRAL